MTKHFVAEIEKVKKKLLHLSAFVEESVSQAVKAVQRFDSVLARAVIDRDEEIDLLEVELEEECLKILALHQPVATDLRFVVSCLKINNDLERIGDLAVNIAHKAEDLVKYERVQVDVELLIQMSDRVKLMLKQALDALVNVDLSLASQVLGSDDPVDQLNRQMHKQMQTRMREDVTHLESYQLYVSVSRNLERIADHATNIAEDVVYMVNGDIIRHGRKTQITRP